MRSARDYERFVRIIEEGLRESSMKHNEFQFGCRFDPLKEPEDYLAEIENFATVGLNCYQLGVNIDKHSKETLKKFGDSVLASH